MVLYGLLTVRGCWGLPWCLGPRVEVTEFKGLGFRG